MRGKHKTPLIKLAENPDEEFADFEHDVDDDEEEGDGGMNGDHDDYGDEDLMDDAEMKGIPVKGPRTKLSTGSYDDDIEIIKNSVAALAKSVSALARVQRAMLEKADLDDDDDDDDGDAGEGIGENELVDEDEGEGAPLSKDDEASTFGEKDRDVPGNRPFDPRNVGDDDTVIQGGPSAGPGPVMKSTITLTPKQLQAMINRSVREALESARSSTIHKSNGPRIPGSSKIGSPEPQLDQVFSQLKQRSFREINRLRTELGDLPPTVV